MVWVGFDQPKGLGRGETGGRAALPIWLNFMKEALRGKPIEPFTQPPGVVVLAVDPQSGLLAAEGASGQPEVCVDGTQPHEHATAADEVDPNRLLMNPEVP